MKNELGGKIMAEFAASKPKACSYLKNDFNKNEKGKGTNKCVRKRKLKFKNHKMQLKLKMK